MTKRILSAAASAVLLLAVASGCGGDGRPSVDEVADGIQDNMGESFGGDVTDEMATCLAKAFHESDLSDDALRAIADGDEDYDASEDDAEAIETVSTESVTKCVGTELPRHRAARDRGVSRPSVDRARSPHRAGRTDGGA